MEARRVLGALPNECFRHTLIFSTLDHKEQEYTPTVAVKPDRGRKISPRHCPSQTHSLMALTSASVEIVILYKIKSRTSFSAYPNNSHV